MKCERCGLCCYDAPCGCGYGKEDENYRCHNFRIKDNKAICLGVENGSLHPSDIGIGQGCSYYLKGGKFAREYSWANEDLKNKIRWFEEDKKNFVIE